MIQATRPPRTRPPKPLCGSAFEFIDPTGNHVASQEREGADRPNIILIVLDTVRADRLKGFGYDLDTMPALERWASNALVATRAISPAGWTSPAHASMFSGKSVSEHGMHYGPGTKRRDPFRTRAFDGISWLPEVLAEQGYDCLAVSANQFAVPQELTGFRRVFSPDHSDWERTVAGFVDRYSPITARLSERLRWRMPYVDARKIVDITMRAVPEESAPVFLFVNLIDAHSPYHPPTEALESLGIRDERLFSRYLTHTELTRQWESLPEGREGHLNALYDAELRWLDLNVDKLLTWIDERFGEDSIVIVTSDHGEELGEQGRVGHEYGLAQSLVHVPLFIRSPSLPSGRFDELVSLRGLFDFIKTSVLGEQSGLEAMLSATEEGGISERYPCGACVRDGWPEYGRPWVSVIEGSFKAVGPSAYGLELYRLDDSNFNRETKHADPSVTEMLGEKIDGHWEGLQDRRETEGSAALSEDEWRRLKALGYVN